jgi:hypothetical protein
MNRVEIARTVLPWVPAACLLIQVVLLFLPWISLSAGGSRIISQSGLNAAFGSYRIQVPEHEGLRSRLNEFFSIDPSMSVPPAWLLILYLITIILGVILAIATLASAFLPVPLLGVGSPWRARGFLGVSVLALAWLLLQFLLGFPMEKEYLARVSKDSQELRQRAQQADDPERQARLAWVDIQQGVKESLVQRRLWLHVSFFVSAVAVWVALAEFRRQGAILKNTAPSANDGG